MRWSNDRYPAAAVIYLLAVTMIEPPVVLTHAVSRAGLLALLPGFLLAAGGAAAIACLMARFPRATVVEIGRAVLGPAGGTALAAAYAAFWVVDAAWLLRIEGEKVQALLLTATPLWATMLYMLAVAAYLVAHGAEPTARLAFFTFSGAIAVMMVFYLVVLARADPGRLWTPPADGPAAIAREAGAVAANLEGISTLLVTAAFAYPPRRQVRAALAGMAVAAVPVTLSLTAMIGIFGLPAVTHYAWPAVAAVQTIAPPGFLVEKLDLIYLGTMLVLAFARLTVVYLAAAAAIQRLCGLTRYELPTLAAGLGIFALAVVPAGFEDVVRVRDRLVWPLSGAFTYGLPALLLALAAARGRRAAGAGASRGRRG